MSSRSNAPPPLRNDGVPLNVTYVTMAFPAGSETFATNDVRRLHERGTKVTVHALRAARPEMHQLVRERGLDSIPITHHEGVATLLAGASVAVRRPRVAMALVAFVVGTCLRAPMHLLRSLFLVPRVLQVFDRIVVDRPDVVHGYWAHYPSLVLYLVQRYVPDTVTSLSFSAYDIRHRLPVTAHVAQRADLVRSLAQVTARETAEAFGIDVDDVEVIHDSVDLRLVPRSSARVPRSILTAGRLVAAKGMDDVLETFASVRTRFPDATLRVLGSGPDRSRLEELASRLGIADAVTFVGHVAQADVLSEMREAEVFLFLSKTERLPNVVKEAMACGCLPIVSRTVGIEEVVDDGVNGFVVDHGNLAVAANHVARIFEGAVDVKRMTEAGAARIRDAFDLTINVDRYLELWQDRHRLRWGTETEASERSVEALGTSNQTPAVHPSD